MSGRYHPRGGADRRKFFVFDLLPECEDADLCAYFGKFGDVDQASVCREKGSDMSRCCGYVWMADAARAMAVLDGQVEHKIWDTRVQVSQKPGPDFAGMLDSVDHAPAPRMMTPRAARGDPAAQPKQGGEGGAPRHTGRDKLAGQLEATEPRGDAEPTEPGDGEEGWFFVGKLKPQTTEQEVEGLFADAGVVEKVVLIRDKATGESKKFGFVKMSEQSMADAVVASEEGFELEPGLKVQVGPYTGKIKKGWGGGGRGGKSGQQSKDNSSSRGGKYSSEGGSYDAFPKDSRSGDGKESRGYGGGSRGHGGDKAGGDGRGRGGVWEEHGQSDWGSRGSAGGSDRDSRGCSGAAAGAGVWEEQGRSGASDGRGYGAQKGSVPSRSSPYGQNARGGHDRPPLAAPPSRPSHGGQATERASVWDQEARPTSGAYAAAYAGTRRSGAGGAYGGGGARPSSYGKR